MNIPPMSRSPSPPTTIKPIQYIGIDDAGRIYTIKLADEKKQMQLTEVSSLVVRHPVEIISLKLERRLGELF